MNNHKHKQTNHNRTHTKNEIILSKERAFVVPVVYQALCVAAERKDIRSKRKERTEKSDTRHHSHVLNLN